MQAFIFDGVPTPTGNYDGAFSTTHTNDLATIQFSVLKDRIPSSD